jgi:hypothetical protein
LVKNREDWGSLVLVLSLAVMIGISGSSWQGFRGAVMESAEAATSFRLRIRL